MEIPIACSLSSTDLAGRVEEWRRFLGAAVEVAEFADGTARLGLARSDQALAAAGSLAEREKACCPFFGFSLDRSTDRWWLCITVPLEAQATLDALVALLPERVD